MLYWPQRAQHDCGMDDRIDPAGLRLNCARDVGEILGLRCGEIERKDRRLRVARGDDLVV